MIFEFEFVSDFGEVEIDVNGGIKVDGANGEYCDRIRWNLNLNQIHEGIESESTRFDVGDVYGALNLNEI